MLCVLISNWDCSNRLTGIKDLWQPYVKKKGKIWSMIYNDIWVGNDSGYISGLQTFMGVVVIKLTGSKSIARPEFSVKVRHFNDS
jgi:hypothetical protein